MMEFFNRIEKSKENFSMNREWRLSLFKISLYLSEIFLFRYIFKWCQRKKEMPGLKRNAFNFHKICAVILSTSATNLTFSVTHLYQSSPMIIFKIIPLKYSIYIVPQFSLNAPHSLNYSTLIKYLNQTI